jgi:hypothetical protein
MNYSLLHAGRSLLDQKPQKLHSIENRQIFHLRIETRAPSILLPRVVRLHRRSVQRLASAETAARTPATAATERQQLTRGKACPLLDLSATVLSSKGWLQVRLAWRVGIGTVADALTPSWACRRPG